MTDADTQTFINCGIVVCECFSSLFFHVGFSIYVIDAAIVIRDEVGLTLDKADKDVLGHCQK
ncbi:hypothetical protein SOVF_072450 [Spinacia oleracea]|nr:hypothetical protein SOVF_072450 [Spinacia oleracea]